MEELTKEQLELKQLASECKDEALQLFLSGKIVESEELVMRAKNAYEKIGDMAGMASTLNLLSIIYEELGNESINQSYLLDALDCAEESDDYSIRAKLYNNLGCEFLYIESYDRALECFRQAYMNYDIACEMDLEAKEKNRYVYIIMNLNFCTIYSLQGEYEHARKHYLMTKEEIEKGAESDIILAFKTAEGLFYWRSGERKKAEELVEPILQVLRETEYATDYLVIISEFIKLLKEMKDFVNWKKTLEIMEDRLSAAVGMSTRIEIITHWIDFYEASGDVEKYTESCVKYVKTMQEKSAEDYAKKEQNLILQIDMRRAAKQKKIDDTMVYLDPLTGIGNRNKMLEDGELYIKHSAEDGTNIAVGLVDIDFFKECNDNYGHIAGDKCLKRVAEVIENAVGDMGNVYRYGGDEFLLLLPLAKLDQLNELGEVIKQKIEEEQIPNEKSSVKPYVTVSQGYTVARAEVGDTIETLVGLVDNVLYSVKRGGRDDYKVLKYSDAVALMNCDK